MDRTVSAADGQGAAGGGRENSSTSSARNSRPFFGRQCPVQCDGRSKPAKRRRSLASSLVPPPQTQHPRAPAARRRCLRVGRSSRLSVGNQKFSDSYTFWTAWSCLLKLSSAYQLTSVGVLQEKHWTGLSSKLQNLQMCSSIVPMLHGLRGTRHRC